MSKLSTSYLFATQRLGFRLWRETDLNDMTAINKDVDVMRFFPSTQTKDDTVSFIQRMQSQYRDKSFCYFAVDLLSENKFIGFVGLSSPNYEADFTPCIDIGWRLARDRWGYGYATEGARKCLNYGFKDLGLDKIVATAPEINKPSISIMKKIGMTKTKDFIHPLLLNNKELKKCVLYEISKS